MSCLGDEESMVNTKGRIVLISLAILGLVLEATKDGECCAVVINPSHNVAGRCDQVGKPCPGE